MGFPQSVIDEAWKRANGKCECTRESHSHTGRCNKVLVYSARGDDKQTGCWEGHHINANGQDVPSNCEILCCSCHKQTSTYGG